MGVNHRSYDEIRVYAGIAERTGVQFDRDTVRHSGGRTGSVPELLRKARMSGDGTYYLPLDMWPADRPEVEIRKPWVVVEHGARMIEPTVKLPDTRRSPAASSTLTPIRLLAAASSPMRSGSVDENHTHDAAPAGKHCVLIVDDDPSIRQLLVTFMRYRGFVLLEARNGREALALMRSGQPELVIMDLMMPEVTGREVLAARELDVSLRRIPVIVLTAGHIERVESEVAGKHVSAVIAKPFDLEKLLLCVRASIVPPHVDTPAAA